jgi:hypothetical protein
VLLVGQFAHRSPVGTLHGWDHAQAHARLARGLVHLRPLVGRPFGGVEVAMGVDPHTQRL